MNINNKKTTNWMINELWIIDYIKYTYHINLNTFFFLFTVFLKYKTTLSLMSIIKKNLQLTVKFVRKKKLVLFIILWFSCKYIKIQVSYTVMEKSSATFKLLSVQIKRPKFPRDQYFSCSFQNSGNERKSTFFMWWDDSFEGIFQVDYNEFWKN